jgi:chloramphenicol-sensitive protein RarD
MASILISVNWLTYIWAVNHNHIIDTSLGYYINPLVSVLLGVVVLKEKLSFWQIFAFFLALTGVLNTAVHLGSVPWVALVLAVCFGLYGLFKKMINLGAITGLTLETLVISPFALLYLHYVHNSGAGAFGFDSPAVSGLLAGAGIVTAVPLLMFAGGARRLPLSIVGFLQYIAPTIALILGIFLYHEPFTSVHLVSFIFIWAALTIFSLAKTRSFITLEKILFKKAAFHDKNSA